MDPRRYHVIQDVTFDFWTTKLSIVEQTKVSCFYQETGDHSRSILSDTDEATAVKEVKESDLKGSKALKKPLDAKAKSRIIKALTLHAKNPNLQDTVMLHPDEMIKIIIAHMACEDVARVLRSITLALDAIELALHDDAVLRQSMPLWREQLGVWRNLLFGQAKSL